MITVEPCDDPVVVAPLLDLDGAELTKRNRANPPVGRWIARSRAPDHETQGPAVGVVTATVRPDDRLFLVHRLADEASFGPLLGAAVDDLARLRPGAVHLTVDRQATDRIGSARSMGFEVDLEGASYEVPFAGALAAMPDRVSNGIDVVSADRVDPDALYALDLKLRNDVPGNDGWRGNRAWFDDEMTGPEFDPAAYPVAVDGSTGQPVGLCRFWRNADGPALGMLGVEPGHRNGLAAVTLLRTGMSAAARWGHATFTTHTARPALRRRMTAIGATETGGFVRLRRR